MTQLSSREDDDDVEYPSSDGEPVAETDAHVDELLAFREALKWRYHDDPNVYVAGNNFIYYEKGNPKKVFSPDVYVVKGVAKRRRRIYKLWEEGRAPRFVIEMSSRKTWVEDTGTKKALCASLGVREYFLYDPEGDVVQPPLQGYRLRGAKYRSIRPRADGGVESREVGVVLWLDDELRLHATDLKTGALVLRPEEAYEAHERVQSERDQAERARERAERGRHQAEQERTQAEQDRKLAEQDRKLAEQDRKLAERGRKMAEKALADAERENARLRAELERTRG